MKLYLFLSYAIASSNALNARFSFLNEVVNWYCETEISKMLMTNMCEKVPITNKNLSKTEKSVLKEVKKDFCRNESNLKTANANERCNQSLTIMNSHNKPTHKGSGKKYILNYTEINNQTHNKSRLAQLHRYKNKTTYALFLTNKTKNNFTGNSILIRRSHNNTIR